MLTYRRKGTKNDLVATMNKNPGRRVLAIAFWKPTLKSLHFGSYFYCFSFVIAFTLF